MAQNLNFYDALRALASGARITREAWGVNFWGELRGGVVMLHKPDDAYYQWVINDGDLAAEDWAFVGEIVH